MIKAPIRQVMSNRHLEKPGKHSANVFECLFCECSSRLMGHKCGRIEMRIEGRAASDSRRLTGCHQLFRHDK